MTMLNLKHFAVYASLVFIGYLFFVQDRVLNEYIPIIFLTFSLIPCMTIFGFPYRWVVPFVSVAGVLVWLLFQYFLRHYLSNYYVANLLWVLGSFLPQVAFLSSTNKFGEIDHESEKSGSAVHRERLLYGSVLALSTMSLAYAAIRQHFGVPLLTWLLVAVVTTTLFTHYVGHYFGKRTFKNLYYPGLTIEGAIAGSVIGFMAGALYGYGWIKSEFGWSNAGVIQCSLAMPFLVLFGNVIVYRFKRILAIGETGESSFWRPNLVDLIGLFVCLIPFMLHFTLFFDGSYIFDKSY